MAIDAKDMKELKRRLYRLISDEAKGVSEFNAAFIQEKAYEFLDVISKREKLFLGEATQEKLIAALCDDFLGLGPLQPLMADEDITEIMINGPDRVYIEKDGRKTLMPIKFDDEAHLRFTIDKMMAPTGRRIDESSPYVDFSLPDGSRVNVIIAPLAVKGTSVTIRKFLRNLTKIDDLVKIGTLDARMGEFLIAAVKAKANILFSGATGSGKTTTLEVLSAYIDSNERIVTIEDALELHLRQEHVVGLLTRPPNIEGKGEVKPRELLRNSLRMRPTRIILGEIRGEEAMDYLQAINSGHRGSLAVLHAARPSEVISRLETMAQYAGMNIPSWAIRRQIASGLNLIVQMELMTDGSRKITYITEVGMIKDDQIHLQDIFRYEIDHVEEGGKVVGKFKAFGKPQFFSLFKKKGISVNESIFGPDPDAGERDYWVR